MKKFYLLLTAFTALLTSQSGEAQTKSRNKFQEGKIIFQLKEDASIQIPSDEKGRVNFKAIPFLSSLADKYAFNKVIQKHPQSGSPALKKTYEIQFSNHSEANHLIRELNSLGFIRYAEKKMALYCTTTTPNDPYYTNTDEWQMATINALGAWAITTGSASVLIADVDNAMLTTHEDLLGKISPLSYDVADNDRDVNPPGGSSASSAWLHGTNTAGIIGANTDNGKGVASIGYNLHVIAIKGTYDTSSTAESIDAGFEGINYAADIGARIVSCSFGSVLNNGDSSTANYFQSVIDYAYSRGCLVIAATGNNGYDSAFYPACLNHVLSVASTGSGDNVSSFSNVGRWVSLCAPGEDIWSCVTGSGTSGYAANEGTSQAAPLVAGLAGLMLSVNPGLTTDQLISCLESSCDNIDAENNGLQGYYGAGRINAANAVACAQSTAGAQIVAPAVDIQNIAAGKTATFNITTNNTGSSNASFTYTLTSNAPGDWSATFDAGGSTGNTSSATVTVNANSTAAVTIRIVPGSTPKLAVYTLSMAVTGSSISANKIKLYVLSNLTDLMVNNLNSEFEFSYAGYVAVAGPTASNWDSAYISGFKYANAVNYDTTNQNVLNDAIANGAMGQVKNVYFNVGWTFPAFNDTTVTQLTAFLNGGGNLMIAGQNIGWDIMSGATPDGTPAAQAFYTTYMNATFVNYSAQEVGALDAVSADPIYGVGPVTCAMDSFYGTRNISLDEVKVKNTSTGHAIYTFSLDGKIVGVRTQTNNYKVVYLGIGLEQLIKPADRNSILKITYDYFHGPAGTETFDKALQGMGQNYPNPSSSYTIIPFSDLSSNAVLQVLDITGRLVFSQQIPIGTLSVNLNTAQLDNGMYMYRLLKDNSISEAKPMQVIH